MRAERDRRIIGERGGVRADLSLTDLAKMAVSRVRVT